MEPDSNGETTTRAWISLEPLGDRAFLAHFLRNRPGGWATARARDGKSWRDRCRRGLSNGRRIRRSGADRSFRSRMRLRGVVPDETPAISGRRLVIPVLYDGVDLLTSPPGLALSTAEVIEHHCAGRLRRLRDRFLPGFPYAGYSPCFRPAPPRIAALPGAGRIRRDRRPPDGDLSQRIARGLALAGNNAASNRRRCPVISRSVPAIESGSRRSQSPNSRPGAMNGSSTTCRRDPLRSTSTPTSARDFPTTRRCSRS